MIENRPVIENRLTAQQVAVRQLLAGRYSGVLITDNDSPRPTDRVYFGYNYYQDFGASLDPSTGGARVNRELPGFEKTFLDGDASFGMRLPFVQAYGQVGPGGQVVGDLTLVSKFALVNDRTTGDLLSGGLLLTVPTGGGTATLLDGTIAPPRSCSSRGPGS